MMRNIFFLLFSSLLLGGIYGVQAAPKSLEGGASPSKEYVRLDNINASKEADDKSLSRKKRKGELTTQEVEEYSIVKIALITAVGSFCFVAPLGLHVAIKGWDIHNTFQTFLALCTLPAIWPISLLETFGIALPLNLVFQALFAVTTSVIGNAILGGTVAYIINKRRYDAEQEKSKTKETIQDRSPSKEENTIKKRTSKQIKRKSKASSKNDSTHKRIPKISGYFNILLSGLLTFSAITLYRQYTYNQKYKQGKKLIEKRIQKIMLDEENKHMVAKKSPITGKSGNNPIYNTKKTCMICFTLKENSLKTTHDGDLSICKTCQDNQKDMVDLMIKNLIGVQSCFNRPYDCNDLGFNGAKTNQPAYLTADDLRALGATENQIQTYIQISHKALGIDKSGHHCTLCQENHTTSKCSFKKDIVDNTAKLYVEHAGYGRKNSKDRFISIFARGPITSQILRRTLSTSDHPCPSCGIVTNKDAMCDSVKCEYCKTKWNWNTGLKNPDVHSWEPGRNYKLKDDILPFTLPFNPNKKV